MLSFVKDPKVQEIAQMDADNVIKYGSEHYNIELDWTDEKVLKELSQF